MRFLAAICGGALLGTFAVIVIILLRAFIEWDWWPDTTRTWLSPESNADYFIMFLRIVFAFFFAVGAFAAPPFNTPPTATE